MPLPLTPRSSPLPDTPENTAEYPILAPLSDNGDGTYSPIHSIETNTGIPVTPINPTTLLEDEMITISAPNRATAVIGPGYFKELTTEEAQNVGAIVSKSVAGNNRQYDVWRAIALYGENAGA